MHNTEDMDILWYKKKPELITGVEKEKMKMIKIKKRKGSRLTLFNGNDKFDKMTWVTSTLGIVQQLSSETCRTRVQR